MGVMCRSISATVAAIPSNSKIFIIVITILYFKIRTDHLNFFKSTILNYDAHIVLCLKNSTPDTLLFVCKSILSP
jgi:hypothetical protein